MAAQKILVPYSHTSHNEKALDFLVSTFGGREGFKVTLFSTYAPLPDINITLSPELEKMRGGLVSLQEELREREAGLEATRRYLMENGFTEDQVDYVFKPREQSIPDEIIETATKGHYRVVVLTGKAGGRGVNRIFARSVHQKVLSALSDTTVCIAR